MVTVSETNCSCSSSTSVVVKGLLDVPEPDQYEFLDGWREGFCSGWRKRRGMHFNDHHSRAFRRGFETGHFAGRHALARATGVLTDYD